MVDRLGYEIYEQMVNGWLMGWKRCKVLGVQIVIIKQYFGLGNWYFFFLLDENLFVCFLDFFEIIGKIFMWNFVDCEIVFKDFE